MGNLIRWGMAALALFALGAWGFGAEEEAESGAVYKPADGFVAHEWGVLHNMGGKMVFSKEDLPEFVKWSEPDYSEEAGAVSKKPVIHFYSGQPLDINVRVGYPDGGRSSVCAWPPLEAQAKDAKESDEDMKRQKKSAYRAGALTWSSVHVGLENEALPEKRKVADGHWWAKARRFGSNPVVSGGESDRFLFYEVANPAIDPNALETADGVTRLSSSRAIVMQKKLAGMAGEKADAYLEKFKASERIWKCAHFFIVQIADGKGRVSYSKEALKEGWAVAVADWAKIAAVDVASEAWRKSTQAALAKVLEECGLYGREARGVAEIWSKEFFQTPGTRAVFVWPREEYDRFFPLALSKKPDALVRVMMEAVEG